MKEKENLAQVLMRLVSKMQPVEFAGLARMLGVSLLQEKQDAAKLTNIKDKYEARDFVDVLANVLESFNKLNRTRKREIIELVKKSNGARR